MTDTLADNSYEEEPIILESELKSALNILGRKKVTRGK